MMGKSSSAVYNINYHIVWCPKYRKPILTGKVKTFIEDQLETIAQTKEYKILESKVMSDHIHLFIEANHFDSPTNIVKIFKGVTSQNIQKVPRTTTRVMERGLMESIILYWYCW